MFDLKIKYATITKGLFEFKQIKEMGLVKKSIMFTLFIFVSMVVFLVSCGSNEYDIVFTDYDDTELCSVKVKEGEKPEFSSENKPTRPSDDDYTYTFSRWYPEITEAKEDKVYKALYVRNIRNTYTITFKNYDDSVLEEVKVKEGDIPSYDKEEDPVRPNDKDGSYVFSGWNSEIVAATKNATYVAQYERTDLPTYRVIFRDEDATLLESMYVKEGDTPEYTKEIPTKESDKEHVYKFAGWNMELKPAYEDITYIAQYETCDYPYYVSFDLDGGATQDELTTLKLKTIESNIFPKDVIKANHKFAGWSLNDELVYDANGNKIKDYELSHEMTFKASYENKCSVIIQYLAWNSVSDSELDTYYSVPTKVGEGTISQYCDWNQNIDLSIDLNEGYTFEGWYLGNTLISTKKETKLTVWEEDVIITSKYICDSHQVTVRTNNVDHGETCIKGIDTLWHYEQTVDAYTSQEFSVAAQTTADKEFLGWYDSYNNKLTDNLFCTFDMVGKDYIVEARWNYFTLEYDNLDDERGTLPTDATYEDYYTTEMDNIPLPVPTTRFGYEFLGWKLEDEYIFEINTKDTRNMHLVATYKTRDDLAPFEFTDEKVITGVNTKYFGARNQVKKLVIPNDIVAIGKYAFIDCIELQEVTLGSGIKVIPDAAFCRCYKLYSIDLTNIEVIEASAFLDCYYLSSVIFDQTKLKEIGGLAFSEAGLTDVTIPECVTKLETSVFKDCGSLKNVTIKTKIETLPLYTFQGCSKLKTVTLPNTVTTISQYGFYGCSSLENITLPANLTTIQKYAFQNCSSLKAIEFPSTLETIESLAFSGCTSLKKITLPNLLTNIPADLFHGCTKLTDIVIPKSITAINYKAFYECPALENVYYYGTSAEWNEINIAWENDKLEEANRYYFTSNGESETSVGSWWYINDKGNIVTMVI